MDDVEMKPDDTYYDEDYNQDSEEVKQSYSSRSGYGFNNQSMHSNRGGYQS